MSFKSKMLFATESDRLRGFRRVTIFMSDADGGVFGPLEWLFDYRDSVAII